jgi:hypothetical protein
MENLCPCQRAMKLCLRLQHEKAFFIVCAMEVEIEDTIPAGARVHAHNNVT